MIVLKCLQLKFYIGYCFLNRRNTAEKLANSYGLHVQRVYEYSNLVRNNASFKTTNGRPSTLGQNQEIALKTAIQETGAYKPTVQSVKNTITILAGDRAEELHHCREQVSQVCDRTYKNIIEKIGATEKLAEISTNTRVRSCADRKNAASFMTCFISITNGTMPASSLFNHDATTFCFDPSAENIKVVVMNDDENKPENYKALLDDHNKPLAYFVKYISLINAAGFASIPVFIIQDNCMPVNEYNAILAKRMGFSPSGRDDAWVVFLKKRAGNLKFYNWYYTTVVIPFIKDFNPNNPTYYQMDGEYTQIQSFSDPKLVKLFIDNKINVNITPGGVTGIYQPNDRANLFKAAKKALKHIDIEMFDFENVLHGELTRVLDLQKEFIKKIDKNANSLSYDHKQKFINALITIRCAIMKTINQYFIINSFRKCGLCPYNPDQILNSLKRIVKLTPDEAQIIKNSVPRLVQDFHNYGEIQLNTWRECAITDADDALCCPKRSADTKQRSRILTHKYVLQRQGIIIEGQVTNMSFMPESVKKVTKIPNIVAPVISKVSNRIIKRKRLDDDSEDEE